MRLRKKLILSALSTVGFLIILEAALAFFSPLKPYRAFRLNSKDSNTGKRTYTFVFSPDNPPIVMPKPPGVYRIFCFGGSSTRGIPWINGGFPDFLRSILNRTAKNKIEVINLGVPGFNSAMVSEVLKDSLDLDPDLCIIYSGNNDVAVFSHINRKSFPRLYQALWWAKRRVRLFSWDEVIIKMVGDVLQRHPIIGIIQYMPKIEKYHESWINPPEKKILINELFVENINAMVKMAGSRGVQVVVCVPGGNIKDRIPWKSVHASGLSKEDRIEIEQDIDKAREVLSKGRFELARSILLVHKSRDPYYARLHFFLGQAELGLGNHAPALQYLEDAIRYDDLRVQPSLEQRLMLLQYCRKHNILVLDVESLFRSYSKNGLPGFDMFTDFCHPTIMSNYLIAKHLSGILYGSKLIEPLSVPVSIPDFDRLQPDFDKFKLENAKAYFRQAMIHGFLYRDQEYLEHAFAMMDKARELGYSPSITQSSQAYIRVLQGRIEEAAALYTSARKKRKMIFGASIRQIFGGFIKYDGTRLDIKPAGKEEKLDIFYASRNNKPPKPPDLQDCKYHLVWNPDQARFVISQ